MTILMTGGDKPLGGWGYERPCPKCGGETAVQHYGPEFFHGETYVEYCMECDWQGEPE